MHHVRKYVFRAVFALAVALPILANAETFNINLDGLQETPPNASPAFGSGTARLNVTRDTLFFNISWSGLLGSFTASHFHRGAAGVAGPVIHSITSDVVGNTAVGFWAGLAAQDVNDLLSGNLYVNVHTTVFPGGEIRGQVLCDHDHVYMDGLNENPPNTSAATGSGIVYFSSGLDTLYFDLLWSPLSSSFTAAHFHRGVTGQNGPVIHAITSDVIGGTHAVGFWAGLTDRDVLDFLTDSMYVNAHSTTFPGGEIRGQIYIAAGGVHLGPNDVGHSVCVRSCPGVPVIVCVGPLAAGQLPSIGVGLGCSTPPTSCQVDCTPATHYVWSGGWMYNSAGIFCRILSADGCVCLSLDGILPVEFVSVAASAGDNSVSLSWRTGSEQQLAHFDITRSENGQPAMTIAHVNAQNRPTGASYVYQDNAVRNDVNYVYHVVAVDFNGSSQSSDAVAATPRADAANITDYALDQNYPNPFNPTTSIRFDLAENGFVNLKVFNLAGQKVADLVKGNMPAGTHLVSFDGSQLPSGIYVCRLDVNGFSSEMKMLLLK
jgi:hypothetical protein